MRKFPRAHLSGSRAKDSEAIPPSLIHAPTNKFQKGIIFWGTMSSNELIPADALINFTKWLPQKQFRVKKHKKMYLTGNLYSKFLTEEAAPAINKVFENTDLTPIFQDDQDKKHRTTLVESAVADLFDERIEPK